MWTDLDVKHLLALRAVAEEGTFGKAATRLGFTQSAVSNQIAVLEKVVGTTIFDRHSGPRRPTLTPAGELLLIHAKELLRCVESAERELDRLKRGVAGSFSIGTFQSMSSNVLPEAIGRLRDEAPAVEIQLVQESPDSDFLEMVSQGELDFCLAVGVVPEEFTHRFLGFDPYVALLEADTPPGPVDAHSFSARPTIGQPEGDACERFLSLQLERMGVTPNFVFRSYDNTAVQGMVRAGVGAAIMPLLAVDTTDELVAVRDLNPPLKPRRISVAWNRERTLPPVADRFVEILGEICAEKLSDIES